MKCERSTKDLSLLLSPIKRYKIKSKTTSIIPFNQNPAQQIVLDFIINKWTKGEVVRLIIIKGRQQGISTLIQLVMLALTMKIPAYSCYVMAHDTDSAKDLFDNKVKFAFDNFPEEFKSLYKVRKDNVRKLQFEGQMQSSAISVGTSARSTTQNCIHVSEPGKMSMSSKTWQEMIEGTLPAGEQADAIIFESTPDGGMGPFYDLVKSGEYDVIFLPWWIQDEYTAIPDNSKNWRSDYAFLAELYKLTPDPQSDYGLTDEQFYWYYKKTKQLQDRVKVQYPCSVDEGFIAAAETFFPTQWLQKEKDRTTKIASVDKSNVTIFEKPIAGYKYSIGVDTSTGEASDPSSITVLSEEGKEVANWTKKADENLITAVLYNLAKFYNDAAIGIEITDMGRVVLRKLRNDYNYPLHLLYRDLNRDEKVKKNNYRFGWFTTAQSRPRLLSEFRSALINRDVEISSWQTIDEMMHFTLIDGKYQAQSGHHDDRIFSAAIAYQVLVYRQNTMI